MTLDQFKNLKVGDEIYYVGGSYPDYRIIKNSVREIPSADEYEKWEDIFLTKEEARADMAHMIRLDETPW